MIEKPHQAKIFRQLYRNSGLSMGPGPAIIASDDDLCLGRAYGFGYHAYRRPWQCVIRRRLSGINLRA